MANDADGHPGQTQQQHRIGADGSVAPSTLGKRQVREVATGALSWRYPVDARELVASGEYEIVSDVDRTSDGTGTA